MYTAFPQLPPARFESLFDRDAYADNLCLPLPAKIHQPVRSLPVRHRTECDPAGMGRAVINAFE